MGRRSVAAVAAAVTVSLAGCGVGSSTDATTTGPVPSAASGAPAATPSAPSTGVDHELLGVQQATPEFGRVDHAATGERYRQLWREFGLPGDPVPLDLDRHVVLFLARAEDACPDEITGIALDDERLRIDWRTLPAGAPSR